MTLAGTYKRPAYAVYSFTWRILDAVFPPVCGGCGRLGAAWCAECNDQIIVLGKNICPICGDLNHNGKKCNSCKSDRPDFDGLRSIGIHQGPLRNAILRLKYDNNLGLALPLGRLLAHAVIRLGWKVDLAAPVPLSTLRLHQRGYNQSNQLSRSAAWELGIPNMHNLLVRTRETRSQVGLSAVERKENVLNAFSADNPKSQGRNILLVDDVTTTSTTMRECARALKQAGAQNIYGITLSRAVNLADDLPPGENILHPGLIQS